jgi:peptidoglycan/LPS O-acetylase OafA/YrhL
MRMVLGRLVVSLARARFCTRACTAAARLVRGDWVVRLGKISYGLYMLHFIGILIMLRPAPSGWGWQLLATKALGFVMTVLLAWRRIAGSSRPSCA